MPIISKTYKNKKRWYIVQNETIDGKNKRRYIASFETKGHAQMALTKMKADDFSKKYTIKTFGDVYEEFKAHYESKVPVEVAPKTYELFLLMSKHFFENLEYLPIEQITYKHIEELKGRVKARGLSGRSINVMLVNLTKVFKFALYCGYIERLPVIVPAKEEKKAVISLGERELNELIKAANPEQQFTIQFLALSGLRPNAAINLKWKDVNLSKNFILVRSSNPRKPEYLVPISTQLRALLLERSIDPISDKVLNYTTASSIRNMILRLGNRLGMKGLSTYIIRKTFASILRSKGVDMFDIAKCMGHKKPQTTNESYIKTDIDYLVNVLDGVFGTSSVHEGER